MIGYRGGISQLEIPTLLFEKVCKVVPVVRGLYRRQVGLIGSVRGYPLLKVPELEIQ